MNLIFTKDLLPGMCISEDILGGDKFIKLLTQGVRLNQTQIDKLKNWTLPSIYVDDSAEKTDSSFDVYLSKTEFIDGYNETIDQIIHAFRDTRKLGDVSIAKMQELIDEKIFLLIETIGVVDYLHDIRCYNEYTFNHSLNVAIFAGILGKWCNYKGTKLKNLILAGLLHDIGKLFVPLSILDKPEFLSEEEFAVIKKHPQTAYQLLHDTPLSENIKLAIWQHHEYLDGSGYPLGLSGDQICPEARIVTIADIYDSITSDRVYRSKMTPFEALDILAADMFTKLDPSVCLTFIDNMRHHFIGNKVILTNGEQAKIIAFATRNTRFTKPVVCMQDGRFIDLQTKDLCIVQALS